MFVFFVVFEINSNTPAVKTVISFSIVFIGPES